MLFMLQEWEKIFDKYEWEKWFREVKLWKWIVLGIPHPIYIFPLCCPFYAYLRVIIGLP